MFKDNDDHIFLKELLNWKQNPKTVTNPKNMMRLGQKCY